MREEYLNPFFAEVTRNIGLARDVKLHADQLRENPLSPSFRRQLLAKSRVVFDWGDSTVALGNERSKLLLALRMSQGNEFNELMNAVLSTQYQIMKDLLESFGFADEDFTVLEKSMNKYRISIAKLWILARNALLIQPAPIADRQFAWSPEGLSEQLYFSLSRLNFEYLKSAYSWSAAWRIELSSEPNSNGDFEFFAESAIGSILR